RLRGLVGGSGGGGAAAATRGGGRRRMSAAARAKIAAAARARWARVRARGGGAKAAKKSGKRKGVITAAGRRRLSQLTKARSRAGEGVFGIDCSDSLEVFAGKIDIERTDVFLQILSPFRSWNRNDVFTLGQDPRERELSRSATFFARDFYHSLHQIEIALKILALKSGRRSSVVVLRQVFRFLNLAGQKTATEGTIGNETDSKLAANAEHLVFRA